MLHARRRIASEGQRSSRMAREHLASPVLDCAPLAPAMRKGRAAARPSWTSIRASVLRDEALAAGALQLGAERVGVFAGEAADADAVDRLAVHVGLADGRLAGRRVRRRSASRGARTCRALPARSPGAASWTAKPPPPASSAVLQGRDLGGLGGRGLAASSRRGVALAQRRGGGRPSRRWRRPPWRRRSSRPAATRRWRRRRRGVALERRRRRPAAGAAGIVDVGRRERGDAGRRRTRLRRAGVVDDRAVRTDRDGLDAARLAETGNGGDRGRGGLRTADAGDVEVEAGGRRGRNVLAGRLVHVDGLLLAAGELDALDVVLRALGVDLAILVRNLDAAGVLRAPPWPATCRP